MISFESFVLEDNVPIYLQIVGFIKRGIVAGTIADGSEMPSRRMLSALLGVNPNTVQKSYAMLEEEGLIQSHTGAKSYMVLDGDKLSAIRRELVEEDARRAVRTLRQMGVSKAEALSLMERYWEEEEGK